MAPPAASRGACIGSEWSRRVPLPTPELASSSSRIVLLALMTSLAYFSLATAQNCDSSTACFDGTCCSKFGFCGTTPDYCGDGCQNGPCSADWVQSHNGARAAVGVPPLSWDDSVAASAQAWADELRNSHNCALDHTPDGTRVYGENLFQIQGAGFTPAEVVGDWVSEQQFYDHNTNTCAEGQVCGHYTQVVWAATTSFGCGSATCDSLHPLPTIVVCQYNPPGNMQGESPF